MTLLVTGGLGFVGSHVVWAAAERGEHVIVLDDRSGGGAAPMPVGVEVVRGDIGDEECLGALLATAKIDAIAHFAGRIDVGESVRSPECYFDVNLVRPLRLLAAARTARVERFLFSSSAAVYGVPEIVPIPETTRPLPINPYGATKLAYEHAVFAHAEAYGMHVCALRYFNAAGAHPTGLLRESHAPETHLIPLVADVVLGRRPDITISGNDHPTPDGTCIRDYVHVMDLASAHLLALDRLRSRSLGAINLGSGRGSSVLEVVAAARALGTVPHELGPRRPGDPPILVADTTRARCVLDWRPTRSDLGTLLEDTLRSRRR